MPNILLHIALDIFMLCTFPDINNIHSCSGLLYKFGAHLQKHGRCSSMVAKCCMLIIKFQQSMTLSSVDWSNHGFHPVSHNSLCIHTHTGIIQTSGLHSGHSGFLFKGTQSVLCHVFPMSQNSSGPFCLSLCLPAIAWPRLAQLQLAWTVLSHAFHHIPRDVFIVQHIQGVRKWSLP